MGRERRGHAGAARRAGPGVAAAGGGAAGNAGRSGWRGWPRTSTRCRAPGSSTRLTVPQAERRGGVPAGAWATRWRPTPGPTEAAERRAARGRSAGQPGQGVGGDLGARHGVRQAGPRLRDPSGRARRRRSPTTSRSAGPGRAPRGRGVLLPGPRTRHLGVLRVRGVPAGAVVRKVLGALGPGPAAVYARARTAGRPRRGRGWRWCSRCSTSTVRCGVSRAAGSPPARTGSTTNRATAVAEARRPSSRPCSTIRPPMMPDVVPARSAR